MKKIIKICALSLAAASVMSISALAAAPDMGAFARALMLSKTGRLITPLVYAADDTARLSLDAARAEEEKDDTAELIDRGHIAYVVQANQRLNMQTGKYYGELTLINETGLFTVETIEDVEDYSFMPVFATERIGRISAWEGGFVQFDMRNTDKIQKLETKESSVKNAFDGSDGFYLVNIADERRGIISFYDTSRDIPDVQNTPAQSLALHEDGHAIIAIDGGEYEGESLRTIPARATSLTAGKGNAVIQVHEGEILRVFSFAE